MPVYLIAYDPRQKPPSVYDAVIKALKEAKAQPAQDRIWLLESPYSAEQNHAWLKGLLPSGDELIVTELNLANTWVTSSDYSTEALDMTRATKSLKSIFQKLVTKTTK